MKDKFFYLFLTLIIAFLLFRIDIGKMISNFYPSNSAEKEVSNVHDNKLTKKPSMNYEYKPESFVERVVTNVVSDFVKTPTGNEIVKNMIKPEGFSPILSSVLYPTVGYNGYEKKYKKNIIRKGFGPRTICGQDIKIQLLLSDLNEQVIKSKTYDYVVGSSYYEELNILPLDQMPNSLIKSDFITLNNEAAQRGLATRYKLIFSIIKHNSSYDESFNDIEMYDEFISNGRPALCGDKVHFNYKIMTMKGENIFSSPIEIKIGSKDNSDFLNFITSNLSLDGKKTIFVEPSRLYSDGRKNLLSKEFKKIKNEFVKVVIEKVTILEKDENELNNKINFLD